MSSTKSLRRKWRKQIKNRRWTQTRKTSWHQSSRRIHSVDREVGGGEIGGGEEERGESKGVYGNDVRHGDKGLEGVDSGGGVEDSLAL